LSAGASPYFAASSYCAAKAALVSLARQAILS
jgi:NAD(P)-dependent dehydrogenase (short-subunit alcohol dehydrogenase family)